MKWLACKVNTYVTDRNRKMYLMFKYLGMYETYYLKFKLNGIIIPNFFQDF